VISLLQQARKDAGLEVSDRVVVRWAATGELAAALDAHRDTIAAEVLATAVLADPGLTGPAADCNGLPVRIALAKA
jgi:isoleucyl-tRNA synthetase